MAGEPVAIWRNSARPAARSKTRALLTVGEGVEYVTFLDIETLELVGAWSGATVPVYVTPDDEQAAEQICPSCGARERHPIHGFERGYPRECRADE